MRSLKLKSGFNSAKQLLAQLALTIILSGCAKPAAKIVLSDTFCEGKYESLWLERQDFSNIDEIRKNEKHRITIDKYINNQAINEKEYEQCPKAKNN